MKYFLMLFTFLISFNSFCADGIILVLNAPLFKERSTDSKIVQYIRKGQKVWVHDKEFGLKPDEIDYSYTDQNPDGDLDNFLDAETKNLLRPRNLFKDKYAADEFYETLDKNGHTAYILKKFVKMVHKDRREFSEKIDAFGNYDPTDYRLEEPLPKGYPFNKSVDYRASFAFGVGPQRKRFYQYNQAVSEENYTTNTTMEITVLKKVKYDLTDRLYFGGRGQFVAGQSDFILGNGDKTTETKTKIGVGPLISYDIFRYKAYRISVMGGMTANYNYSLVDYNPATGTPDNRTFTGWSFEGNVSSTFQREILVPNTHIFVKTQFRFALPHTLTSDGDNLDQALWNLEDDSIEYPFGGEFSWMLGLQSKF